MNNGRNRGLGIVGNHSGRWKIVIKLTVLDNMGNKEVVFRYNWMRQHNVTLDLRNEMMTLGERLVSFWLARSIQPDGDNVLQRTMEEVKNITWEEFMPKDIISTWKRLYENWTPGSYQHIPASIINLEYSRDLITGTGTNLNGHWMKKTLKNNSFRIT
jgi:hypothetical protein